MRWILNNIGAVAAADFYAKEQELKHSQQALSDALNRGANLGNKVRELTNDLNVANAANAHANKTIQQIEWTNPYHVEFLSRRNEFKDLVLHTVMAWRQFGNGLELGVRSQFKGGINPAGLYWALTHASVIGSNAIKKLDKEDVMTSDFVTELSKQLACATNLIGSSLDVYAGEIHKKLKPALKEISVGADLLLLISGKGLVPRGGLRLLWLQFKQTNNLAKPLELNVYRTPNASRGTQLGALRKAHQPNLGSFGLYALASIKYPFFASIPVDDLEHVTPMKSPTCLVNLAQDGVRLQELVLKLSSDPAHGQFATGAAVMQFVDALASQAAIVPLTVLSVASGEEIVSTKDLVRQIKAGWDRRLQAHIDSLTRAQKQELQIDDDGPSLSR